MIKKKTYFHVLNILYVSNESFIKKNWNQISKKIFGHFKVFFCGQHFLKKSDCVFPEYALFSLTLSKEICVKNLPANIKFNTIYSETNY